MNTHEGFRLSERLQHIYVPFLVVAVAFIAAYVFFDWLLTMEMGFVFLDDELVGIWLPLALSSIATWIWLSPRVKGLRLTGNWSFLFALVAAATMAVPTIVAHSYLATATGKLTHLARASELREARNTKYYAADDLCVTKSDASVATDTEASGRNSETLIIRLYVVVPLCADQPVTATRGREVWIGTVYLGDIDNRLSEAEKNTKYRAFLDDSNNKFNADNSASYTYFEQVGNIRRDQRGFQAALEKNAHFSPSAVNLIVIPHTDPFELRNGDKLTWVFAAFGIGTIAWLIMILLPDIDDRALSRIKGGGTQDREKQVALAFIVPRRESYAVPILLDLNALVFLTMVFAGLGVASFRADDLLAWGANYRPAMHGLGLFRLFTSQFVHGGLMHLANNLFSLLIFGLVLQSVIGPARFLVAYLLSGLGGGIASIAVHPATVSVGASGGIFGLLGVLLILFLVRDEAIMGARDFVLRTVPIVVGINLIMGFLVPGIDNAAHVGGLITGAILGLALHFERRMNPGFSKRRQRKSREPG